MGNAIRVFVVASTLIAGVALAACSSNDAVAPTVVVSNLTILSGNGQTDTTGMVLPDSLTLKVTDQNGNAVAGETINWTVASGGGSVNPASSVADANGVASTVWTLGPSAGTQTVTAASASNASLAPATFTATAVAPAAAPGS